MVGQLSPALELRNLQVALSGRMILRGVSLSVEPGSWVGLLGANGSGKTTLLRAIAGRLEIAGGHVLLAGQAVEARTAERSRRIGFTPPPSSLPELLTAGELLTLAGEARGADPRQRAALYEALEVKRLEPIPIGAMSAGMRQRVAVFLAFVGSPDVVLLDEPFNWLDPVGAYDLKAALSAFVASGGTILTALHDIAAFASRCERGVLLHQGRVIRAFDHDQMAAGRADLLAFEEQIYQTFKTSHLPPSPQTPI